jgi:citrate lyase subunit beta / citryl-CoA lyase
MSGHAMLLRSWMFVPGNKERYLRKALASEADCLIFDLEDGVLPAEKDSGRTMLSAILKEPGSGPVRYVRVNAIGSQWFEPDLAAAVKGGATGVCVPKVEEPGQVRDVSERLGVLEQANGLSAGTVSVVAAIESAAGLIKAPAIAQSSDRLVGLMLGAEDLALDIGLGPNREGEAAELVYARSALVMAAASVHLAAIDGVYPRLDDPAGLTADTLRARRLGFTAKATFNPRQLGEINRIFSPGADEISYARKVVAAVADAASRGDASVAVGGQLVDRPIVLRAQRLLYLVEERGLLWARSGKVGKDGSSMTSRSAIYTDAGMAGR